MKRTLLAYYRALRQRFGPRRWWPADTPFEMMVGAILTQNTAWTNVEKAIENLKSRSLLNPRALHRVARARLAQVLRPAGYFRVKADRLKSFVDWFLKNHGGSARNMKRVPRRRLREQLLTVRGIGPETADSILLYALGKKSFVVDTYTHRVLTRHALIAEDAGYDDMKKLFEDHLPRSLPLYNDFHAQIVEVGKEHCGPRARCDSCPLRRFLP